MELEMKLDPVEELEAADELQALVVALARKHGYDLARSKGWLRLELGSLSPLVIGPLPDREDPPCGATTPSRRTCCASRAR